MSIERLKCLVPPPNNPSEIGSAGEWNSVEKALGLELPSDYRAFVYTYGSGRFAQFYRVYNPFAASEYTSLYRSVQRVCEATREFKCDWPEQVPYAIHPERPGLLPWGNDENGNYYFWFTNGPPDEWQVLSDEVRGEGLREYACTMTEFLVKVLTGEVDALAGNYPKVEHRVFEIGGE